MHGEVGTTLERVGSGPPSVTGSQDPWSKVNRESAKRYRRSKLKQGYFYLQYWVPEEVKEEARAAVIKIVKKAEAAREAAGIPRRAPKT